MNLVKYKLYERTGFGGIVYQELTAYFDLGGETIITVQEITGGRKNNAEFTAAMNRLERFNGNIRDESIKRIITDRY